MRNLGFLLIITLISLSSCEKEEQREERLARTYCSSCHQFPEPALLDKKTWTKSVLPEMAFRMGVDMSQLFNLPKNDYPFVTQTLPNSPMVSPEEWEAIVRYFEREAPDTLHIEPPVTTQPLTQFKVEGISLKASNKFPMLSLLQVDTTNQKIFTSNRAGWFHKYNYSFQPLDSLHLYSPVSSISLTPEPVLAAMGIMDPNDQPRGSLLKLAGDKTELLEDSLKRPVFVSSADFNGDKKTDYVVCNFGNYGGDLQILEAAQGGFTKHILSPLPGARKVIVQDFNGDGLPDVLALLTQGDEQVVLYTNGGGFKFKITTLLRFPSVYGSSYFELADFNNDGHFDILYTNGDNADYSLIFKPYHGVRIFINNGQNQFAESWFYNMLGCSWAVARDFDQDGDQDIAAISFFPDFAKSPEQSFIYFENQDGKFKPYTTPMATQGRWLLMEVLDIDNDKDKDILLGALDFNIGVPPQVMEKWKANPVSILLLRNNRN